MPDPTPSTLFTPSEIAAANPAAADLAGPNALVSVALEASLDKTLTYAVPKPFRNEIKIGQRVKVPLGRANRPAYGYVVSLPPTYDGPTEKLKRLLAIADERVLLPLTLLELARWMSRYYVCPLGTVLETVIPAAVKKRIGLGYTTMAKLNVTRDQLQQLVESTTQPKRRALLARLLQVPEGQSIPLFTLANEAGTKLPAARKLAKSGLISLAQIADLPALELEPSAPTQQDTPLNEDQQKVFTAMLPKLQGGFSTTLLMGVTGSGKTEVYLQCIRKVIEAGKQAIVLVPEIALTPQTVRRFTARFPRVAVLHSGLTATARHRQWQTILTGNADVVVGARSAIFAPVPNLGILVVDEEHESSYKQDQAPRYHARDLAIKRAQLEQCPILLGSATPSLETYARAIPHAAAPQPSPRPPTSPLGEVGGTPPGEGDPAVRPIHELLVLPRRVRGIQMPHVELVDMKQELKLKKQINLLSSRLDYLMRNAFDQGHQVILLLNRRGYSNFVFCNSCQEALECKFCDATLTYHRNVAARANNEGQHSLAETLHPFPAPQTSTPPSTYIGAKHKNAVHTGQLHCHYCLAVNPLPDKCPTCGKLLSLFGLGTQRVEEELLKKFPALAGDGTPSGAKFARVDSDTMRSGKDYEKVLARFATGDLKLLLGTQMIAKGLDFPNVSLVGVISGDTALALPDFRAAERTFQLITQVAGRAGRGDTPGRVVLQTYMPEDPTIQSAINQDYVGFAERELGHRQSVQDGLPPYARLTRIIYRDEDEPKWLELGTKLAEGLTNILAQHPDLQSRVSLMGPMPCAIGRIAGFYRGNLLLKSATPTPLQKLLALARQENLFGKSDKIAIDVDPVSLL